MAQLHVIDGDDTVAVALTSLEANTPVVVSGRKITIRDNIPAGHKLAIAPVSAGGQVIKYGFSIGVATCDIEIGDHVHDHNLVSALSVDQDFSTIKPSVSDTPVQKAGDTFYFEGYRRPDGRTGTRNEIWILPTVGCVNATAAQVAKHADSQYKHLIDGIYSFPHQFGCSQLGDDLENTARLLAGLASNPNAGGVLIMGLGCENNQIAALREKLTHLPEDRIRFLAVQDVDDEFAAAMELVQALVAAAADDQRSSCGLEALVLGLKCGGSDGYSGLTANPLLGAASNRVCAAGGSALLTEIPEMFGAEALLLSRAADQAVQQGLLSEFSSFRQELAGCGHAVSSNPSPGNKRGGITTLEEKSLGAVQKGGQNKVVDVLAYGEPRKKTGLSVISAPGNDAVSSTALAAAGANLILFTTGRGTPLGFPVPTVKVASNSELAARKAHWIDVDAGRNLGMQSFTQGGDVFLQQLCAYASGKATANERLGAREIAIWKKGVTL